MNALGIYFGPRAISIVETKGKKLLNNTEIPQSAIYKGELEEKYPMEIKALEVVSLFRDALRRNKIEAKEATLCLSGRDLIIRTFDLPLLPREELPTAVNFEAKKYIPFKVEDLVSNFQVVYERQSRTNQVLFIGIKKEALEKYLSILTQLELRPTAVEYSAFSVLRCLKLAGASESGIIGILGADLRAEDEINFTVLEHGFPLFSRDISLGGRLEELGKVEELGLPPVLEKLKTEIRVSLDYYHRKYLSKPIKKLFLFTNQDYRADVEAFLMEIGLSVQFIDVTQCIDRSAPQSLSFIKAYSASLAKTVKTKLKVDLLAAAAAKEKAREPKARISRAVEEVSLATSLPRKLALVLLLCGLTFGFGLYRLIPVRKELNAIIGQRPAVTTVNPEASLEDLSKINAKYKGKLEQLNYLVLKQLYLTEPLNLVPKALPQGVWLTNFSYRKQAEDRIELILQGSAYLADNEKELSTINQFLANLKADPTFAKYFKEIAITSIDSGRYQTVTVTDFLITCKAYREKE